jgi:hypothetical protein
MIANMVSQYRIRSFGFPYIRVAVDRIIVEIKANIAVAIAFIPIIWAFKRIA